MIEHWLLLRCTSWRLGLAGWTTFALSVSYIARQRKATR